jgi:hypothetical protein
VNLKLYSIIISAGVWCTLAVWDRQRLGPLFPSQKKINRNSLTLIRTNFVGPLIYETHSLEDCMTHATTYSSSVLHTIPPDCTKVSNLNTTIFTLVAILYFKFIRNRKEFSFSLRIARDLIYNKT